MKEEYGYFIKKVLISGGVSKLPSKVALWTAVAYLCTAVAYMFAQVVLNEMIRCKPTVI